jgi:hypothetical protein
MATYDKKPVWFMGSLSALAVMALIFVCSAPVQAGLVAADTANAMQFGTKIVQYTEESNGKYVDGSVDYAVYAPGKFNSSFPGQDPSNGTQYVYRYQLYNNAGTSSDYMKKLTVGLVGVTLAANCKYIEPGPLYSSGGIAPLQQAALIGTPNPTSASWSYGSSVAINPGNYSKMLIFTSPYGPTERLATIYSQSSVAHWVGLGGEQYNWWEGQLPSPVPEPASMCGLLAFGGILLVYRTLRRK